MEGQKNSGSHNKVVFEHQHEEDASKKVPIYGSKSTLRLVDHPTKGQLKMGFGWSGCTPSAQEGWFWTISDHDTDYIYKVHSGSGESFKIKLSQQFKDLESMCAVHKSCLINPKDNLGTENWEGFFIVSSLSKKTDPAEGPLANRMAFIKVPVDNQFLPEALIEGTTQFTLEGVRERLLELLLRPHYQEFGINLDPTKRGKSGGLNVEGSAFLPCKSSTARIGADHYAKKSHRLYLGLRGPGAKHGKYTIITALKIKEGDLEYPQRWAVSSRVHFIPLDHERSGIRDMVWEGEGKHTLLTLVGPTRQDKPEPEPEGPKYPLIRVDLDQYIERNKHWGIHQSRVVGMVPRLKNGELSHQGLPHPQLTLPEVDKLKNKENEESYTSPEGICKLGDKLLLIWDHNDMGLYALFDYPKF